MSTEASFVRGQGWFSAAYGPFRRFSGGDKEYASLFESTPRLARYLSIFDESVALTECLDWLRQLRFRELEGSKIDKVLLERLREFINQEDFLPFGARLHEISSKQVTFVDGNAGTAYGTNGTGTTSGFGRAQMCPGTTYAKLAWLQAWHIRDETYSTALAELVNAQFRHPFAEHWGDGTTSVAKVKKVNGIYTVTGTHTYDTPGRRTLTIRIWDVDRGSRTSTNFSLEVLSTADVQQGKPITP